MHIKRLYYSFFLAVLAGVLVITPALAVPPLPSSFYGIVKINGNSVHDGTLVRGFINGVPYAETHTQTYLTSSVYSLDIPGDDPSTNGIIEGGRDGDIVHFEIENFLIKGIPYLLICPGTLKPEKISIRNIATFFIANMVHL